MLLRNPFATENMEGHSSSARKKDVEKLEEEQRKDELEANLGRRLEAGNAQEKVRWENVYGQPGADSGIGTEISSTRKGSSCDIEAREINGKKIDSIEMDELRSSTANPSQPQSLKSGARVNGMLVRVAADDILPTAVATKNDPQSSLTSSHNNDNHPNEDAGLEKPKSIDSSFTGQKGETFAQGPKIDPLPFKIPKNDSAGGHDTASIAASNASSKRGHERYSQRFSGLHLRHKVSQISKRLSTQTSSSVEALVDESVANGGADGTRSPRSDGSVSGFGDAGSYQAANTLRLTDHLQASEPLPQSGLSFSQEFLEATRSADGRSQTNEPNLTTPKDSVLVPDAIASQGNTKDHPSTSRDALPAEQAECASESDGAHECTQLAKTRDSIKTKSSADSWTSRKSGASKNLKDHLPEGTSKVVSQYRTNEWAKHLTDAEKPDVEEIGTFGPVVDEPTAIVNAEELLQTPLTAEPSPAPTVLAMSNSSLSPDPGFTTVPTVSIQHPPSSSPIQPTWNSKPPDASANATRTSLHSDSHRSSHKLYPNTLRSSSSPLVVSPIDEDAVASFHPSTSPLPANTLLAHRSALLSNKSLTGSSRPPSATPSPYYTPAQTPTLSRSPSASSTPDQSSSSLLVDENLPLSTRKSHLRRTSGTSPSNIAIPPNATSLNVSPPSGLKSPEPSSSSRHASIQPADPARRRASMLAAWHESLAQDAATVRAPEREVLLRREEMWEDHVRERRSSAKGPYGRASARASVGTGGWGSGPVGQPGMGAREVNDAHREVLRKMQASAYKALAE